MDSHEVRKRFLDFFEKRGHAVIPSASLVPENDPSVLFTTAGVQPIVPYILEGSHPKGNRLVSVQKCVRTTDIEDIGDKTHATFFEMLGNWSIGDPDAEDGIGASYFKIDAIKWSFEFLTNKEEGLGLDVGRLYVTVFEGDENAPKDEESIAIWSQIFKEAGLDPLKRIFPLSAKTNWWPQPKENDTYSGPCGPSTEMFYDLTSEGLGDLESKEDFEKADDEQRVVEIWNDVFMEYQKKDGKVVGKLPQKNVDTGAGLERLLAVLQKKESIFETDLFQPIMEKVRSSKVGLRNTQSPTLNTLDSERVERIVADHLRTSVFLIADGVTPSNTDRGYILRRLIRRAVRFADVLEIPEGKLLELVDVVAEKYKESYSGVLQNTRMIKEVIGKEEEKFRETLHKGLKEFEKGRDAFTLFSTYGFPLELTLELAREKGIKIDTKDFEEKFKKHQELSKSGAGQKFKGGLSDSSEETVKLHTAHHLLLAALQKVLGENVKQRGSNITPERLRIDFSFERKMTDEEKQKVEDQVNQWISEGLEVVKKEMKKIDAEKIGAEMEFGAKYPDTVSVYFIQDKEGNVVSKEFCGGPHIKNTSDIGQFKIKKEEAVAAGVRRIKGVLG